MSRSLAPPHLVTLIILTGFSPLSLNMFLPSLANIAADLSSDYKTVSLAIAGYLAITAVIQLIVGPVSDRIGRRPVLLVVLILFAFASLGCALAEDIWTFLIFRTFQGGMAAGSTLSMAIVRDTRSERQAASLIGYIGMSMAIAPMLGPMLGGILDTAFGWRATFYFYATAGFFLLVLCWFDLGETSPRKIRDNESTPESAVILLREPLFWAFAFCGAFSIGTFYIFLTGAPLVAKSVFGVTTAELGFYIGTITAGFMFGGFLSGRFAARYSPATMILTGRIIAFTGLSVGLSILMAGHVSPYLFFASTVFVGIGNGITLPSNNAAVMSINPDLAGSAAGLAGALIVASGAVLTTLTGQTLPSQDGAQPLLTLMLGSVGLSLCFALWARWLLSRPTNAQQGIAYHE